MAGFLYFLSGYTQPKVPREELARLGLAHLLDGDGRLPVVRPVVGGPGGGAGVVIAMPERLAGRVAGYHPDAQEWPDDATEIVPEGQTPRWRLGWWKDAPPTPEDLERKQGLPGVFATLADGGRWRVPVLRQFDDGEGAYQCSLPRRVQRTAGGWQMGSVKAEYLALWQRHLDAATAFFGAMAEATGDEASMDSDQLMDHAIELLGVNYTVGPVELSAIGAVDTETLVDVMRAACEMERVEAWAKKNLPAPPATPLSTLGDEDLTLATPLPGPTL